MTQPLVTLVDLDQHVPTSAQLSDGRKVTMTLTDIETHRDTIMNAIRAAKVWLRIDDQTVGLPVANYHLPQRVGAVQVDCTAVRQYYEGECGGSRGATHMNNWHLEKDARIRLWPADSPWIRPGTFRMPLDRSPFASDTWFANEPVSTREDGSIYYHVPLDFGGAEGCEEVYAATDGVVVEVGEEVLDGTPASVVKPRYDRVMILDDRGWYYTYAHLLIAADEIAVGQRIKQGQRLGWLGKEGTSGGWAHLHFDVRTIMPSGEYAFQDCFAYLWQAYLEEARPALVAVARPRHMAATGETVRLDGTRSWPANEIAQYQWFFTEGGEASGPIVERSYDRPGIYCETLKITDQAGNTDYDFVNVHVAERRANAHEGTATDSPGPHGSPIDAWFVPAASLHAACYPTRDIRVGDEVTFSVRVRARDQSQPVEGEDVWNFGDGSDEVRVRSNVDTAKHAPEGYAKTTHRYSKPGDYLPSVRRETDGGYPIVNRLHVRVLPAADA